MKKYTGKILAATLGLVACLGIALADIVTTPTQFRGDVNFDHVGLSINGTPILATAAQLNSTTNGVGGGVLAVGKILIGNATNCATAQTVSGVITITTNGATAFTGTGGWNGWSTNVFGGVTNFLAFTNGICMTNYPTIRP